MVTSVPLQLHYQIKRRLALEKLRNNIHIHNSFVLPLKSGSGTNWSYLPLHVKHDMSCKIETSFQVVLRSPFGIVFMCQSVSNQSTLVIYDSMMLNVDFAPGIWK